MELFAAIPHGDGFVRIGSRAALAQAGVTPEHYDIRPAQEEGETPAGYIQRLLENAPTLLRQPERLIQMTRQKFPHLSPEAITALINPPAPSA